MELYSVTLKNYKGIYYRATVINLVSIILCYLLVLYGFAILPPFYNTQNITSPIILLLVLGSFWHARYYNKQVKQLDNYTEFDEKLLQHIKIYRWRLFWLVITCASSSFLYELTAHKVFLYLAIFDFVVSLPAYPNKALMQKELKNDDLIFL